MIKSLSDTEIVINFLFTKYGPEIVTTSPYVLVCGFVAPLNVKEIVEPNDV